MNARSVFALFAVAAFVPNGSAEFIPVDLEKVPVARLAENLEKLAKDNPKNAEYALNLARTHAMAFAKKADAIDVAKRSPNAPWLGYAPTLVPFGKVERVEDEAKRAAAMANLDAAKKWYAVALKIDAENAAARIGLAWVTDQSGAKAEAIKLYRALVADAWEKNKEKELRFLGLTGETITTEAGRYLLALLDPKKDQEEINVLSDRIALLKKLPRPITPIAVPLADGLTAADLEDRVARVNFDADGTGEQKAWTWITPKAAWLVYDPKGTGEVRSGLQLFGGVTFRLFWSNGYAALTALDDDRDGKLSGKELAGLALWHDANANGVADAGEVKPLADHGIVSVACAWRVLEGHPDRIAFSPTGVTFANGNTRPTFDLILRTK